MSVPCAPELELDSGYLSRLLRRRSDALAAALIGALDERQRERLVAVMADVERLLNTAMVDITVVDPEEPAAQYCLREYYAELDRRFDAGFDPQRSISATMPELRPPGGLFLVATIQGTAVGCGALIFHEGQPPYIKRMWVAESARGMGLGRRLLAELERHAAEHGAGEVQLETNKALVEAIAMYRGAGYVEVSPFNDEPYAHHWFRKELTCDPDLGA